MNTWLSFITGRMVSVRPCLHTAIEHEPHVETIDRRCLSLRLIRSWIDHRNEIEWLVIPTICCSKLSLNTPTPIGESATTSTNSVVFFIFPVADFVRPLSASTGIENVRERVETMMVWGRVICCRLISCKKTGVGSSYRRKQLILSFHFCWVWEINSSKNVDEIPFSLSTTSSWISSFSKRSDSLLNCSTVIIESIRVALRCSRTVGNALRRRNLSRQNRLSLRISLQTTESVVFLVKITMILIAVSGIYILTPNGRFKTNTSLCLTITSFHPDSWNPSW